ncbi:MAG: thiamine pyrophosphate-binding protein [Candidatus Melainabacteria bacterium]|nr:thiamine pyrophosphate-binding protein [Candidatus Melainabacteria bacterium]
METISTVTGAELLIRVLISNQVDTIFGVPGESFLAHLESMREHRDKLRFFVNRHEGGAAFMAEAYAKVTGKPGVLFVSRFPGAANAAIGVAVANEDATPLVMFVGQVDQSVYGRHSFQEIDYGSVFGSISKKVLEVRVASRIPEIVNAAFQIATSGEPGPVVVVLPHDVQLERVTLPNPLLPHTAVSGSPSPAEIGRLINMIRKAERPLLIVGGPGWSRVEQERLIAFASDNFIPVATASRCNDLFPNDHPNYAGVATVGMNPALAELIAKSDLLIALGCRLDEMTTSRYSLLSAPKPEQTLVHIYPRAEELGSVYQAELPINAGVSGMLAALHGFSGLYEEGNLVQRKELVEGANAAYLSFLEYDGADLQVDLSQVVKTMQLMLPPDAIIANGAGNNAQWLDRFFQYRTLKTKLTSRCGSMGYGVPAAIAAKLALPQATVVSWNGDGCFQMNMNELVVASKAGLKVIFIIVENGVYGTIRQHQEKTYPCHKFGTDLDNPDFMMLAAAYGCLGIEVGKTSEFRSAFQRALEASGPSIITLKVSPDLLSPGERLSNLCPLAEELSSNR